MNFDRRLKSLASHNPLRQNLQHSATRRTFMAGLAAGVAAASLPLSARAQSSHPLALLTWDAYIDPRLVALWKEQTGGDLKYEIHISDPTSVNRLRAGETAVWDFINVNNPWARDVMWADGLIRDLPRDRFEPLYLQMKPKFAPPYKWATSQDGEHLLGIVQRFETFDFVVNSDVISPQLAKDEGWDLFNNPYFAGRYGISPMRIGTSWISAWAQASTPSRKRPKPTSRSSRRPASAGSRMRPSSLPISSS